MRGKGQVEIRVTVAVLRLRSQTSAVVEDCAEAVVLDAPNRGTLVDDEARDDLRWAYRMRRVLRCWTWKPSSDAMVATRIAKRGAVLANASSPEKTRSSAYRL